MITAYNLTRKASEAELVIPIVVLSTKSLYLLVYQAPLQFRRQPPELHFRVRGFVPRLIPLEQIPISHSLRLQQGNCE